MLSLRGGNPYLLAGLTSMLTGITVVLLGQFIFPITWVTALGAVLIILSFVFLVLGQAVPKLPLVYSRLLLETGLGNITAMVEELGISTRAVYLPASMTGGRSRALVPLHNGPAILPPGESLPDRMLVRYGTRPDDIGLLVTTVGTAAVQMLPENPGSSPPELEAALVSLMSGILGVADGVRVSEGQGQITIELSNPRVGLEDSWSYHCLGGPLASLIASVIACARDRPVQVVREEKIRDKYHVELKLLT